MTHTGTGCVNAGNAIILFPVCALNAAVMLKSEQCSRISSAPILITGSGSEGRMDLADLSREGHRQRLREQYLSGGMDNAPDHHLLELFLSIVIPRRDVKELSYDLINQFGSLEGVLNAEPQDLMNVKGVGESTAVAISSIKKLNDRVIHNRNKNITYIITIEDAKKYFINELCNETVEKIVQVNTKNNGKIINKHIVGSGTANCCDVDVERILQNAMRDKSAYVFLAHNHPDGEAYASANDIDFTFRLKRIMDSMTFKFVDHIIVAGEQAEPIIHAELFEKYFKEKKS